jgi:hypothetical protein
MVSMIEISTNTELFRYASLQTLVDDRLNCFVDVVMLVFASDNWGDLAGHVALDLLGSVDIASSLLYETSINVVFATVLVNAVLDGNDVDVVLLREYLLVDHQLLSGVVVVLVNLLVDSGDILLVLLLFNSLVLHSRGNLFVNSDVVLTRFGHDSLDGGLGGVHCDDSCWLWIVVESLV